MPISAIDSLSYLNDSTGSVQDAATSVDSSFSDLLKSKQNNSTVDLDALFTQAAQKYGVPENLLKAVANAESSFNPEATSSCGAMGVMQLMPGTAAGLGVTDAYDPEQNIMGGAKYLGQLLSQFNGNTELAVAAYNAGPGNVTKYGGVPPFAETQAYVEKVLSSCGEDLTAGTVSASSGSGSTGSVSDTAMLAEMMRSMALLSCVNGGSDSSSDSSGLTKLMMMSLLQTWLTAAGSQSNTSATADTSTIDVVS